MIWYLKLGKISIMFLACDVQSIINRVFLFKLNALFCSPGQVPILLFVYSQCCSKGKIYCICINWGRDRSAGNWTETWNWPSRTCWWDIFWYLWQIWTGQWTHFGQLLCINSEFTLVLIFVLHVDRLTIPYLKLFDRVMMLLLTLSRPWMTFSTCIHW